jgi:pimeloyl-ACP methyl ester carboxylesterase
MMDASPAVLTRPEIAGFTNEFAEIGSTRLHYRRGGDPAGPPVLLWHGFLGTSWTWRKVAPLLADAGLSVLVPDMRGYGDSDKPPGVEGYDARALAEEFRALARQLGFGRGRPITLMAHDMGAPAALLWAADHPEDIAALLYLDEPVLLADVLSKVISYTPDTAKGGSLWWWLLALAPGAPEKLIAGNERNFLTWFYERDPSTRAAIEPSAVDEYLRTFTGPEGVLGALGVYRAVFATMEQTAVLTSDKVQVPIVALGGERGLGEGVRSMVEMVASHVSGGALHGCGHFLPEERPEDLVREVLASLGSDR